MTCLAITGLSITIDLLLVVFVIVCLLMSMIILMQRPKNEGLGAAFGSGATDQLFGARTTNVLQKATVYLSTLFFILTLTLAVLITKRNSLTRSFVAEVTPPAPPSSIAPSTPAETPITPEAVTPPAEAPAPVETPAPAPETPAPVTPPAGEDQAPETTPAPPAEGDAPAEPEKTEEP
jgi:preprotein translocase subunit SecG